jgi:hypothetical protein
LSLSLLRSAPLLGTAGRAELAAASGTRRTDRKKTRGRYRKGKPVTMAAETFSVVESSMLTCTLHDAAHSNFGGDFFHPPLRVHVAMIRTVFFSLAQYLYLFITGWKKVWTCFSGATGTSWAG